MWWVSQHPHLTPRLRQVIQSRQSRGLGASMISCWEVAKLAEIGKLQLSLPTTEWLDQALAYPAIQLLNLTLPIIVASTELPGKFHRDPADQILVATAMVYDIPILTMDRKILDYFHVQKV